MRIVFDRDDDGGYKVLSIPAVSKENAWGMTAQRCGHEFDCCGCLFVSWVSRRMFGLYSITAIGRNI